MYQSGNQNETIDQRCFRTVDFLSTLNVRAVQDENPPIVRHGRTLVPEIVRFLRRAPDHKHLLHGAQLNEEAGAPEF